MLTSKEPPKIIGLEITANYDSLLDGSVQKIKIEASFRKKLVNPTRMKAIKHEFFDSLGEPILREGAEIEAIDLTENLAEKFRALIARKALAVRDIYDIYFILKKEIVRIDRKFIELVLIKINEHSSQKFQEADLISFIESLESKLHDLDEKEISAVIKSDEKIDVKEMIRFIIERFKEARPSWI
jgi:predicted nucleotidyltransferase component of viral defense system